jgi:hypothetical protein
MFVLNVQKILFLVMDHVRLVSKYLKIVRNVLVKYALNVKMVFYKMKIKAT